MDNLLLVPGDTELAQGISPALSPVDGLLWFRGQNVRFHRNRIKRLGGRRELFRTSPRKKPLAATQADTDTHRRLYVADRNGVTIWTQEKGSQVEETFYLGFGAPADSVAMETWGTWLVAAPRGQSLKVWKGDTGNLSFIDITTPFSNASHLIRFGPHIVAFKNDTIWWCDEDDVENWDIANPASAAGELVLRDMDSFVFDVSRLGNNISFFTRDSMGILTYSGAPFYFGYQVLLNGIGSDFGSHSVVPVGPFNYGLGVNGFWRTDGNSYEYIDANIDEWIFDRMKKRNQVVSMHDERNEEVIWSFTSGGFLDNNEMIVFNYKNNTWSHHTLGYSRLIEKDILAYAIGVDEDGIAYYLDNGSNVEGEESLSAWIATQPLHFGAEEMMKFVQEIEVSMKGTGWTVEVFALYDQEELSGLDYDDLESTSDLVYSGSVSRIHYLESEAQYFILRISSTGVSVDWEMSAFKVRGTVGGFSRWP